MKKYLILSALAGSMLAGCGFNPTSSGTSSATSATGNIIGAVLGAATNPETITNAISSVIGLNKLTASSLIGTWQYDGPGCAFTSENALAKAGGEVMATEIENKLQPQYDKLGFKASNTYISFSKDGTFSAQIDGKPWSGQWQFDEKTQQLRFSGLLLNLTGYAVRNGSGISILFESKKILTLFQTLSALSGNTTLSTIGDISKNYDGVRIGFDMKR